MKLNGSLVFDASSASEIQNLRVQKYANYAAVPAYTSADVGRLVFVTDTATMYFGSGVSGNWITMATGGDATALQNEVNALETTLGALVNTSGVFQVGAVTGPAFSGSEADVTELLQALSNYANANNTLAELDDVALVSAANKDFLMYDGAAWVDHVLVAADLTDVTSTAAELNILDGATLTVTELNYVDGVTSGIQDQLDNKQALDAGLTALAAFNTNGIIVQTADNTFAGRSLTAPAAGITITNPDGVSGSPTFALANDLAAVEALATTGYIVRTGDGTATTRTIGGQAGRIVITDGDGVASNTDIDLATVTNPGDGGSFMKVTTDTYGRVSNSTAVVAGDITALVDSAYVNVSGDTMSSNASLTFVGTGTVTGLPAPVGDTDAANKAYVDAIAQGLTWKNAVHVLSTADVSISSAPAAIDGFTLTAGDRVLLTAQSTPAENGIYVFNGAASAMTRALDADAYGELNGAAVFVQEGTASADTGWVQTAALTAFTGQTWSQFSGSTLYTWGVGLALTGNTVNVNLGSGIFEQGTDAVGIELHDAATGAIILTTDGSARSVSDASKLHLLLDGAGALAQTASGLKINAASVTNAMLVNPAIATNSDAGAGSLALGSTLLVAGTSAQGITTSASGTTVTISASDATTASKGVASFDSGDFDVAAGVVTIKEAGVDNAQLANSTVTLTGTSGSDAFALGESVAVVGGAGGEVSTAVTDNQVAISVRDATASLKGVASFAAADFTVTAGDVTMVAKALDSLTDVATSSVAAGQTLVYNGTNFVNRKVFHTEAFTSSTSWVVSHGIGQKFCNVTVIDAADEMVIPQSVTFDSATQLTVTFNTAIAGQVAVSGVNAGA